MAARTVIASTSGVVRVVTLEAPAGRLGDSSPPSAISTTLRRERVVVAVGLAQVQDPEHEDHQELRQREAVADRQALVDRRRHEVLGVAAQQDEAHVVAEEEDRRRQHERAPPVDELLELRRALDALPVVRSDPPCLSSRRWVDAAEMVTPFPERLVRNRSKVDLIDERWSERDERRPPGSMLGREGGRRTGSAPGSRACGLAGRGLATRARAAGAGPVQLGDAERGARGHVAAPAPAPRARRRQRAARRAAPADAHRGERGRARRHRAAAGVRRRGLRPPPPGRPAGGRSPARCATTACAWSRGCTATHPGCPLRSAIVAPLVVRDRRVGALVALYDRPGRLRLEETRVVGEAAALVSAMVELSEMEAQGERLARAELRALRAQISPHFIYNALAAVASFIHSRPEEARELLTEFAEFIRYAFARQRAYVTVADELRYVEKYLRLEQARFGDRLTVRVQVDPEVLQAVLPVLSLQPLVENAVRHGVERQAEGGAGRDRGDRPRQRRRAAGVRRRRRDRSRARPRRARRRGPGIGLGNVHGRLLSTFGEGYGLRWSPSAGPGHDGRHDAAEVPGRGAARAVRLLAVDDELPALEDLVRMLEASPAVERVEAAASAEEALVALGDGAAIDARVPRRAHAGARRARARARAAAVRAPAGGRLRLRVRRRGGRRVRAGRARLPGQAGLAHAAGRGDRARARGTRRPAEPAAAPGRRDVPGHAAARRRHAAARPLVDPVPAGARRLRARGQHRGALPGARAAVGPRGALGRRTASCACTAASSSTSAAPSRCARA